jgi:hypothetical protein
MASLILSTAGNAAFGPVGGFLGALAGNAIDSAAITALTPARAQPSRLAGLKVQASQEGAPIPIVYGRFRVAGQVIWGSKFQEINKKRTVGGKGGQRVVERSYSISFAIGLCEGPIDGIGKVWANGNLIDLSTVPHRLYLGGEDQMPDPLIEALEGMDNAPAYRGLAYIVFEDMPLGPYGDRLPQMSFEVMASPRAAQSQATSLKHLARGVCLIPGAGEFAYATTPIRKVLGPGHEIGENVHVQANRADFDVALDQLARDLPSVYSVSLVVAWFGTDLRAGQCQILPKVEDATKQTTPRAWSVAGLTRTAAGLVSQSGGKPAYGGSPDDQSVIEAIFALKSRGVAVTHNPFIMMDVPAGNALPNPLGGTSQPPYPWRGRISCFPGIGQAGSVDATATATAQINAFFGNVTAAHFSVSNGKVTYSGPNQWSYSRFILHQAALCSAAGGVDSFLIGSELIGLTRVRGSGGDFPAVAALTGLAAQVRALLGSQVKISYGADWTEYGAYSPPGTSDLRFPLDPLWADANIDYIGLDWYAPLTDRRDGEPRADIAGFQAGIEGGEAYDFYYASDAARQSKTRTPITDGAYQEPWVWRQKDIRAFWSNPHYERTNGVQTTTPTQWTPKSKPIALMELGFPAVDKGANRPSVFPDPKSVEAGIPPFSNGTRDDLEQRLALEATLTYWRDNNPSSPLYGGNMMDMSRCHLWAWDARPYPYFPGLIDLWGDGAYAMLGHWLAGRAGNLTLSDLIDDVCARAGLTDVMLAGLSGQVEGFAIEAPISARTILDNVFTAFGLEAVSSPEGLRITDARPPVAQFNIAPSHLLKQNNSLSVLRTRQDSDSISAGRFSAYAIERDFQPATYTTPIANMQKGRIQALTSAMVVDGQTRQRIAERLARIAENQGLGLTLAPSVVARMEPGDRFALGDDQVWRADRLEGQWSQNLTATPAPDAQSATIYYAQEPVPEPPPIFSPPVLVVLDITAPYTSDTNPKPLVGAGVQLWPGEIDVELDDKVLGSLTKPMTFGQTTNAMPLGPVGRLIRAPLSVSVAFGTNLPNSGQAALLSGDEVTDIISWRGAQMVGAGIWQLTDWVRGLGGATDGVALPSGTMFILLDDALQEMPLNPSLVGATLSWRAGPNSDTNVVTTRQIRFDGLGRRPWSPCHVRAKRQTGSVDIRWTRRARGTGDGWGIANAPLGARLERYRLTIVSATGVPLRVIDVTEPRYLYANALELADFGGLQSQIQIEIAQIGDDDLMSRPVRAGLSV